MGVSSQSIYLTRVGLSRLQAAEAVQGKLYDEVTGDPSSIMFLLRRIYEDLLRCIYGDPLPKTGQRR